MGEEKEKMKTGKKVIIALIIILLIFTAAAYGYGVHYFTDHFLPGSQVNGFNCSYKTADETEKLLAKEVQAYVLTVETRNNGKESITAKEAGLVYKPDGGARKLIKKQDRYKWFLEKRIPGSSIMERHSWPLCETTPTLPFRSLFAEIKAKACTLSM